MPGEQPEAERRGDLAGPVTNGALEATAAASSAAGGSRAGSPSNVSNRPSI